MDSKSDIPQRAKPQPGCNCSHDEPEHEEHSHDGHSHDATHSLEGWRAHWNLLLALILFVLMFLLRHFFNVVPVRSIDFLIHGIAYMLAGVPILRLAFKNIIRGQFFTEFVLMSVATLGAFYLGAYSEGVAVMVFYCIGEWFQDSAVSKAKRNIKALLDLRPDVVTVVRDGELVNVPPSEVSLNEIVLIRHGEKVALDGTLLSEKSSFNAAALTGESRPTTRRRNELIYAGMINLNTVTEIRTTALFKDSTLSRILKMVQEASARKSPTQLFISKFAKVYTPIVFFLAVALCLLPFFLATPYHFDVWFYRALVFLVVSCPCALVISIPLGYFGGIGLASRHGILFKGGNYLDVMTKVDTVVMDKTGTLTKGIFKVQSVNPANGLSEEELIRLVAALEKNSTHPVAKAIAEYAAGKSNEVKLHAVEEISGMGMKGTIGEKEMLAGNTKLLEKYRIPFPKEIKEDAHTVVLAALGGVYAGCIVIADELKEDAVETIRGLHAMHIETIMLSGDRQNVVNEVSRQLGMDNSFGDLLPEDKLWKVQELKNAGRTVAFAGDGINDAPVIALSDAGIAMGGLGSHATIETADVVIQNDQPSKIVAAIKVGRLTRSIVWQNIVLAMSVKGIVLILGAGGLATLWEAVIADVGVALLAILNAVRIQRKQL